MIEDDMAFRHDAPWTPREEQSLMMMYRCGCRVDDMARVLERTKHAVIRRASDLRLKKGTVKVPRAMVRRPR